MFHKKRFCCLIVVLLVIAVAIMTAIPSIMIDPRSTSEGAWRYECLRFFNMSGKQGWDGNRLSKLRLHMERWLDDDEEAAE